MTSMLNVERLSLKFQTCQTGMSMSSATYDIFFYIYPLYIDFFISLPLGFLPCSLFNLLCNNAFEQGNLEAWRYQNAFIIIIIIWTWLTVTVVNM